MAILAIVGSLILTLAATAFGQDPEAVIIDEGSATKLSMEFQDSNGSAATPTRLTLFIDDAETGTRFWGPVNPTLSGATLTVNVPPAAHRVFDNTKRLEEHVLSGSIDAGASCTPTTAGSCDSRTKELRFFVRNLHFTVAGATAGPTPQITPTP